jgi:tetratricopeptide (TPR) repeat protein
MSKLTSSDEAVLAEMKVDSTFIKSLEPRKRVHYIAFINWLTQYSSQPEASPLKRLNGFIEAFHHLCEVEDWNRAVIFLSLTTLPEQLGHRDEKYQQELFNIYSQLLGKYKPEIDSICLNGLGNFYYISGDYSEAINYYQRSIQEFRSAGDYDNESLTLRNLSKVYFDLEDADLAVRCLKNALEITQQVEIFSTEELITLGDNYFDEGIYKKASECYEQALASTQDNNQEMELLEKLAETNKCLAESCREENHPEGADYSYKAKEFFRKSLSLNQASSASEVKEFNETPKVFISYSHDSQKHKDRVLALSDRLREDGIDCTIDQYEESPAEGWQRWMLNQVEVSNFVLIVCTEQYDRRFRGREEVGKGKGVTWEGSVIIQELYDAQGSNSKFIPVMFTPQDTAFIPNPLRSTTPYHLDTSEGYELLRRRLTNQHATPKPELGSIESLPHCDRQQFFLSEDSHSSLKEALFNASKGLLNWKRTLGNDQHISRPEIEQLQNRIATANSSTTIVLGAPGVGKSSLMATLGHWTVEEKCALLAIKADYLSNTVNTIEDLQHDIQLSMQPRDAIKAIANTEKVVLLIDQLDAVSELLDRQPGRLNVLLSLIQSLAGTKNVHIVATCREFEFRHGTQFARLDYFERLDLHLPTWEQIFPLLEKEQHDTNRMGEPLRELLQNPLHLRIFLEIAKPGEQFESFSRLLDQLWEIRINSEPEAQQLIALKTQLAERMTEEEVLWLPSSIADENPETCRTLKRAGILMSNQDNSTLGFCHQTFYDHTLARAFARGSKSLADLVLERQDGLFIRPILLRSLNYLRGTAPQQYQRQLQILLSTAKQQVRSHIRTLLIEFVGAQGVVA